MRDRESIWSVPAAWRNAYFKLFVILVGSTTGLVAWHEVAHGVTKGHVETFLAIARGLSPVIVVVAAWSVVSVEVGRMFSEWYLNRRYAKGWAEGRARERERWEAWNRLRMDAEEQGKKFTEPPPDAIEGRRRGEHS